MLWTLTFPRFPSPPSAHTGRRLASPRSWLLDGQENRLFLFLSYLVTSPPLYPSPYQGEGEFIIEKGRQPLLNTLLSFINIYSPHVNPKGLALRGYRNTHTNTIEGFWSLVNRGIDRVHHIVSAKYLQDYINAYAIRWNHRNDEKPMFLTVLEKV